MHANYALPLLHSTVTLLPLDYHSKFQSLTLSGSTLSLTSTLRQKRVADRARRDLLCVDLVDDRALSQQQS